jgi:hypothetical protein
MGNLIFISNKIDFVNKNNNICNVNKKKIPYFCLVFELNKRN